jgi:hypothetical protein
MLVIGTQWLCKSLYPITETSRGWRWRWTFAIFASLWLTFGIVIGASGAAKHTRWLIASNEPLYKERINYFVDMRGAALEMKYLLEEPRENLNGVHGHAITSMARRRSPLGLLDRYQYILLTDASNHIDSALLIPRDPEAQRRFGFVATSQPDKVIPMDQLSKYFQP